MQTTGYHTLEDRDNVDKIEEQGPQPCNRSRAWLGDGYYFWDDDIKWAHDWGKNAYGEYMIFKAEILIDENTYDLFGNTRQRREFREIIDELLESGYFKSNQEVTVSNVIEYLKKFTKFPFNSIRAADNPGRAFTISFGGRKGEAMVMGERVQICFITKKNLLSQTFSVVFPLKYVS